MKRRARYVALSLLLCVAPFANARYPDRSVTLVVPAPAGSNLDGGARIVAEALASELGQTFIVQNVAGAMGQIGIQYLLSRNPNGYVLCYCNDGSVITVPVSYMSMKERPPYDGTADLAPIAQTVDVNFVLVANNAMPVKDLTELVRYMRDHPDRVNVAAASPMAVIVTALLRSLTGEGAFTELRYLKNGEPEGVASLMRGDAQIAALSTFWAKPAVVGGKLKAFAAIGGKNLLLPEVRTLAEQSTSATSQFVELVNQLTPWNGMLGPKHVPVEVVSTISTTLRKVLADPAVADRFSAAGQSVHFRAPEEFGAFIKKATEALEDIVGRSKAELR